MEQFLKGNVPLLRHLLINKEIQFFEVFFAINEELND